MSDAKLEKKVDTELRLKQFTRALTEYGMCPLFSKRDSALPEIEEKDTISQSKNKRILQCENQHKSWIKCEHDSLLNRFLVMH